MQVKASLNYLHIAPRKVRLVTNLIKGLDIKRAELELRHLPRRSSNDILKLLKSAVANARNNFQLDTNELFIKEIKVDGGPVFKRFRPRAFGRAAMIRKRTCHVSLVLDTKGEVNGKVKVAGRKNEPVIRQDAEAPAPSAKIKKETAKPDKQILGPRGQSSKFVKKVFRRKAI